MIRESGVFCRDGSQLLRDLSGCGLTECEESECYEDSVRES